MFKEKAHDIYSAATAGYALGAAFWTQYAIKALNPQNLLMTDVVVVDGKEEHFYSKAVTQNVPGFMVVIAVTGALTYLIMPLLLENPKNYTGSLFQDQIEEAKDLDAKEIELLEKEDPLRGKSKEEVQDFEFKAATSSKFLMLALLAYFRSASCTYYLENFKFFTYFVFKDDFLSKNVYVVGSIISFVSRLFIGNLWKRLSPQNAVYVTLCFNLLIDIFFTFFRNSSLVLFIFFIELTRVSYVMNYLFNNLVLYSVFPIETSAHLMKYYELYMFAAIVHSAIFNSFVEEGNFGVVLWSFVMIDLAGFVLAKKVFSSD